jgi:hypothetical protein
MTMFAGLDGSRPRCLPVLPDAERNVNIHTTSAVIRGTPVYSTTGYPERGMSGRVSSGRMEKFGSKKSRRVSRQPRG